MKFSSLVSLIVFIGALIWSWNLIHQKNSVPFETHAGIQEKLAAIIIETVKAKRPAANDIVVDKIWTESLNNGRVTAHFLYSYKDSTDGEKFSSQIKGHADLERGGQDGSGSDRWVVAKVKTTSDAIIFEEGLTITADSLKNAEPKKESPPSTSH